MKINNVDDVIRCLKKARLSRVLLVTLDKVAGLFSSFVAGDFTAEKLCTILMHLLRLQKLAISKPSAYSKKTEHTLASVFEALQPYCLASAESFLPLIAISMEETRNARVMNRPKGADELALAQALASLLRGYELLVDGLSSWALLSRYRGTVFEAWYRLRYDALRYIAEVLSCRDLPLSRRMEIATLFPVSENPRVAPALLVEALSNQLPGGVEQAVVELISACSRTEEGQTWFALLSLPLESRIASWLKNTRSANLVLRGLKVLSILQRRDQNFWLLGEPVRQGLLDIAKSKRLSLEIIAQALSCQKILRRNSEEAKVALDLLRHSGTDPHWNVVHYRAAELLMDGASHLSEAEQEKIKELLGSFWVGQEQFLLATALIKARQSNLDTPVGQPIWHFLN